MRQLSDPASLATALSVEVADHVLLRDRRTALERAEELLSIATEHGMRFHVASAAFYRGWALADEGRGQEGLAEMSRALPALEGNALTPTYYTQLADGYRKNGRPEEGLTTAATALREMERGGERRDEPELYTVKGELLLMRDSSDEAEAERCFRTAIDVARRQKARFMELRATTSLGVAWPRNAKPTHPARLAAPWTSTGPKLADGSLFVYRRC